MLTTLLFDLDNTLIGNEMSRFLPRFFGGLKQHTQTLAGGDQYIEGLLAASREIINSSHPDRTNTDVIWDYLAANMGMSRTSAKPVFDSYYRDIYPDIQEVTEFRPQARTVIEAAFAKGYRVVIATNPLFPQIAIEERLRWAGVPSSDFAYTLVTSADNMHSAKPNVAYYEEILAIIDAQPAECLMIGDDIKNDIRPAASLGIPTYFIPSREKPADSLTPAERALCTHIGPLDGIIALL